MNVGLLSDIHANAVALAAVLAEARELEVDSLLCCGDFVGYYYSPLRVLELLDEWKWQGIRGNHEAMLESWLDGRARIEIKRRYGSGIEIAAGMPTDTVTRLLQLPTTSELLVDSRRVLLCHGSSWDPDHYIYPDAGEDEKVRLAQGGQDLVVFGHSHYPVVWRSNETTIVNPGSVGQPRDRKPGASWAVWDTREMAVTFRRTTFDPSPVVDMAKNLDPHLPYLASVLTRN